MSCFIPLGNRVVLELEESKSKTAGGLYIPDTGRDAPTFAKIVSWGPGCELEWSVGQRVSFSKHHGCTLELPDHSKVHIVTEDEILGFLEDAE